MFIPWPIGPHGNAETNAQKVTANACYVIPVGVEDPELVYNVLYDLLTGTTTIPTAKTAVLLRWPSAMTPKPSAGGTA